MAQNEMSYGTAAERVMAPDTVTPVAPRMMELERVGETSSPYSRRFPTVRGGICEYCGVVDPNYPSHMQYKLCEHYRGQQLRCVYCSASKNPDDVINHAVMHIAEHPDRPGKIIAWCDSYDCSRAHEKRFRQAAL